MAETTRRRAFLSLVGAPVALAAPQSAGAPAAFAARSYKIKLSCNLYSFNAPLRSGAMTLEQAVDYCAELGFEAVDPTGYYFPGHPEVPTDAYIAPWNVEIKGSSPKVPHVLPNA